MNVIDEVRAAVLYLFAACTAAAALIGLSCAIAVPAIIFTDWSAAEKWVAFGFLLALRAGPTVRTGK